MFSARVSAWLKVRVRVVTMVSCIVHKALVWVMHLIPFLGMHPICKLLLCLACGCSIFTAVYLTLCVCMTVWTWLRTRGCVSCARVLLSPLWLAMSTLRSYGGSECPVAVAWGRLSDGFIRVS